jgi:hypothetical protein
MRGENIELVHREVQRAIDERIRELVRRRMIFLDLPYWPRRKRKDTRLGLAICIPIYGYAIYKLLGG